ncbi:MAG: Trk system potassium transporter TrkA [Pirellulaceae bacterium]|nr:Trk system potassium transporter TrkA [Pirellulaceae bacterium]
MRILVLGAGTVGTSIANLLCHHRHMVTVVDDDPDHVRRINEMLDVRAVSGSASQSSVLFQADVLGADLCLAVTGDDEVNLVAASMAKSMGARRTIARVYAPVFRDMSTFDYQRHFNIDRLLSLEHLSAIELARGIRNPGSVTMENFAQGGLEVNEIVVREKTRSVGVPLKSLELPSGVRIGSIHRDDRMWIAGAEDILCVDDRITLIGERDDIDELTDLFRVTPEPKIGVVIAGGGETGYHLARSLEGERCAVVLMESSEDRASFLAANLKHSTILQVDATRHAVLEEERVGSADVFVACTGDDENNIMAGVEAREIGAKRIMSIVSRPDYAHVVGNLGIDLAVSPREVMARQVMGFLNTGPVISRTSLPGGSIEVIEMDVLEGAPATEHVLANLALPNACLIAALTRDQYVRVPGAGDRLEPGDTVVTLVDDSAIEDIIHIFSVNGD